MRKARTRSPEVPGSPRRVRLRTREGDPHRRQRIIVQRIENDPSRGDSEASKFRQEYMEMSAEPPAMPSPGDAATLPVAPKTSSTHTSIGPAIAPISTVSHTSTPALVLVSLKTSPAEGHEGFSEKTSTQALGTNLSETSARPGQALLTSFTQTSIAATPALEPERFSHTSVSAGKALPTSSEISKSPGPVLRLESSSFPGTSIRPALELSPSYAQTNIAYGPTSSYSQTSQGHQWTSDAHNPILSYNAMGEGINTGDPKACCKELSGRPRIEHDDLPGYVDSADKNMKRESTLMGRLYNRGLMFVTKRRGVIHPPRWFRLFLMLLVVAFWVWLCLSLGSVTWNNATTWKMKKPAATEQKPVAMKTNVTTVQELKPLPTGNRRHVVIHKDTRYPDKQEYFYFSVNKGYEEITLNVYLFGPFELLQDENNMNQDQWLPQNKFYIDISRIYAHSETLSRPQFGDQGHEKVYKTLTTLLMKETPVRYDEDPAIASNPYDYNNTPRLVYFVLAEEDEESLKRRPLSLVLKFGVDKANNFTIPFSFQYVLDDVVVSSSLGEDSRVKQNVKQKKSLTVKADDKILIGLIPVVAFVALLILRVNPAVAALFAIATAAAESIKYGLLYPSVTKIVWWIDWGMIFYVLAVMLLTNLFLETNIYSLISYWFLKLSRMTFLPSVLMINFWPALFSVFMNNILVSSLMLPFAYRTMEILGKDPVPVMINMLMIVNVIGRCYVGTFAARMLILKEVKEGQEILKSGDFSELTATCCCVTATLVMLVFLLVYFFIRPQDNMKMRQVVENRQIMRQIDLMIAGIPDVSRDWHLVKRRLVMMKKDFDTEAKHFKIRYKRYGPEPKTSLQYKLGDHYAQSRVRNWLLFVKCCVILIGFLVVLSPYVYVLYPGYNGLTLAFISLNVIAATLLMVHSRDLEIIIGKLDWQAVCLFAAFSVFVSAFNDVTHSIHHYLWNVYGKTMRSSPTNKKHFVLLQIITHTAIAGVINEHVVFACMLETVLLFAQVSHLDGTKELLGGFIMATGFWGNASPLGTGPNILAYGHALQMGFKFGFLRFMRYGVLTAVFCNLILYFYMLSSLL